MKMAALIGTKFLMMYCPSSVGAYGKALNVSAGNRIRGIMVPGIWTKSRRRVTRSNRPLSRPRPMSDSQAARSGKLTVGPMTPKLSRLMVRVARSAAGLQSGTNLMAPNQRKTTPSASRVRVRP